MTNEAFEDLKRRAESGDVQAMIAVGDAVKDYYFQQEDPIGAVINARPWYHLAAGNGSPAGAYMAILCSEVIMQGFKAVGKWDSMMTETDNVLQYGLIVLKNPDSSQEMIDKATEMSRITAYNYALGLYMTDRAAEAAEYLDVTGAKPYMCQIETVLRGDCEDDLGKAFEWLQIIEGNGKAILPNCDDKYDVAVMVTAYIRLSTIYRAQNDCNKAREILLEGLAVVDNPQLNAALQQEIARYHKKMFGGYQYAE